MNDSTTQLGGVSNPVSSKRAPHERMPSADHLMAIAEFGRDLASGTTSRSGLKRAMQVLDSRLGARRCLALWSDPRTRELELLVCHGLPAERFRPRYGTGVAGRVAESGQPIVVPSVRHEAMALSELSEPDDWINEHWSQVAVPLVNDGGCVGVLSAYFPDGEDSDFMGKLGLLGVVAALIAQAFVSPHAARSEAGPSEQPASASKTSTESMFEYSNMIGASAAMRLIYEEVGQVARTNATALIRGESGTGKELVAHAIHYNSVRAKQPFIRVNCAALPDTLFESEVFGHERGAFTGAHSRKRGRFELAEGGTLFLDEVGDLTLPTQAKLLRVLQSREFERLGGTETLRTDVRIIAATNRDLEASIASGAFRQDLYYRLNVFSMTLPPLRDRRADIPPLAEYFLAKYSANHRRNITRISSGALDRLARHGWPGNVRELENVIERAVVVCDGFVVQEHHLPAHLRQTPEDPSREPLTLHEAVARVERRMLEEALQNAKGNCARAARNLGTTERIVRYKANRYGIDLTHFRA